MIDKLQRRFTHLISYVADKLYGYPSKPSWNYVPDCIFRSIVESLLINEVEVDKDKVIIRTSDNRCFYGPSNPNAFTCKSHFLKRSHYNLEKVMPNLTFLDGHAALMHNIVNRYFVEQSAYPNYGFRTCNLRSGDTFIDIGSFRGYLALKASLKVGREGKVLAFEPIKANFDYLQSHQKANNVSQLCCYCKAVSTDEQNSISFIKGKNQLNSQVPDHLKGESERIDVANIHITSILKSIVNGGSERVIFSISTNGTEIEMLMKILVDPQILDLEYVELCIPILFIENEKLRILKAFVEEKQLLFVQKYPWLKIVIS